MISVRREPPSGPVKSPLRNAGVRHPATRRHLSRDLIARRRVLAQAEGVQDLMNDLEFGLAALLLEVPAADEDDAATRLGERGGIPRALGFSAAIRKPNELEKVICGIDRERDEGRLEQIP